MCCSGRRSLSQNIIKGFVLVLSVFVTMDRQKIGAAGSTRATTPPQPPSRPRRPPKPSGTIGRSRTRSTVLDVVFKEDQARFGKDTAQGTWPRSAISPSTSSDIPSPCRPSQLAADGRPGTKPRHGPSASGSAARWPDGTAPYSPNPARLNLELAPTASTPAIVGAGWAARMAITVSRAICARRPCTTAAPEPNLWTKAG